MTQSKNKFMVVILESPSATDLFYTRYEGDALTLGLEEIRESHPRCVPIIQFSGHRDSDRVQLSSGETARLDRVLPTSFTLLIGPAY